MQAACKLNDPQASFCQAATDRISALLQSAQCQRQRRRRHSASISVAVPLESLPIQTPGLLCCVLKASANEGLHDPQSSRLDSKSSFFVNAAKHVLNARRLAEKAA